jgi:predicted Ser/Thr protein kinase
MNSSQRNQIETTCKEFCAMVKFENCRKVGEGAHSIVYQGLKGNKVMCFKVIPKKDFENSSIKHSENEGKINPVGEWEILKLLK